MKKILLIDDEPDIVQLTAKRLTHAGYEVVCYESGLGAFEEVLRVKPDLILLDIRLPGISGLEVYENIKINKKTKSIPIIFFSANISLKDECLRKHKAQYFIKKPYDAQYLLEIIKSLA